jgi:hypothetical protein
VGDASGRSYGYYLAWTNARHGDGELARAAERVWRSLGLRGASWFDGVSIEGHDDIWTVRVVVANFFDPCQPAYVVTRFDQPARAPTDVLSRHASP